MKTYFQEVNMYIEQWRQEEINRAATLGDLSSIKRLLRPYMVNQLGLEVMSTASTKGHADIVGYILDNSTIRLEHYSFAMYRAISNGHPSVVRALLSKGVPIDFTAVRAAINSVNIHGAACFAEIMAGTGYDYKIKSENIYRALMFQKCIRDFFDKGNLTGFMIYNHFIFDKVDPYEFMMSCNNGRAKEFAVEILASNKR